MINMFNFINKNYNPKNEIGGGPKNNIIMPLYATLFHKFGFFNDKDGFIKLFPKFVTAIMKQYGLKSGKDITNFVNDTPTL